MYGFDGGKKIKGRKRQTLVDSLGLLLKVVVSEANSGERVLAAYALMELLEQYPEILEQVEVMWVDAGYAAGNSAFWRSQHQYRPIPLDEPLAP